MNVCGGGGMRGAPDGDYLRGDLVELRYDAQRGFSHLFEVESVLADGTLWLSQLGDAWTEHVRCRVDAADVGAEVLHARPETVVAIRQPLRRR